MNLGPIIVKWPEQPKSGAELVSHLLQQGYRILAPGELDPDTIERCAENFDDMAATLEKMRGVYPGDPHGAMADDAKELRATASQIRALTDGGRANG